MQILEDEHDGPEPRAPEGQHPHGLEDLLAPAQRIHRRNGGVARIHRQQKTQVRDARLQLPHPPHPVLDLGDDLRLAVELLDPDIPAELLDERQEGDRLAEGDALPFEPGRVLSPLRQRPLEFQEQPGLAEARVPRDEHDLAAPVLDLGEELGQHAELPRAADEGGQASFRRDVEAGAAAPRPKKPATTLEVASLASTLPGRAFCCIRAARFVVSPTAV